MNLDTTTLLCNQLRELAKEPAPRTAYVQLWYQVLQAVLGAVVMNMPHNREMAGEFLVLIKDVAKMDYEAKRVSLADSVSGVPPRP